MHKYGDYTFEVNNGWLHVISSYSSTAIQVSLISNLELRRHHANWLLEVYVMSKTDYIPFIMDVIEEPIELISYITSKTE